MRRLSPDYVILGLLAVESCHGYQLLSAFERSAPLGRVWSLGRSQLYAILKRLERQELIDGSEVFTPDAPPRTQYWLTPAGLEQFQAWLYVARPSASTRSIRTEFLSRLYLARRLEVPTAPMVTAQRAACLAQRDKLQRQHTEAEHPVTKMSLDLSVSEMTIILDWLDRCEAALASDNTGNI